MRKNESKLISSDLWEAVKQLPREKMPTFAAIAYYSQDLLKLRDGDELVCDASDDTIESGASSGHLLLALHRKGVKIYNQPTLHAKVACVGLHVVVGSANASENSRSGLIEAAVLSQDSALRAQAMALVRALATKQKLLDETELKRLAEIKVVRKKNSKPRRPLVTIASESVVWWLGTGPLGDRAKKLQEPQRKLGLKAAKRIANDLQEADFETISWPMSARVAKAAKTGDRVVQAFASPRGNERNCEVHAPAAIVHIERTESMAIFFLRSLQATWESVTIGKVRTAVKKTGGRKLTAKSARVLSKEEFAMIERLY